MANKKLIKGYKGKTFAKVIAGSVAAGVVTVAIVGGSIISKLNKRPQVDNPYDDTNISETTSSTEYGANTDNLVTEPPIETETSYETDYETETLLPELQETMIPDPTPSNPVEDLSVEFVDVLAKLTNESKAYLNSMHGTSPNITILGLNTINIDSNNYEIKLLGQAKVNNTYHYFVASMINTNTALDIYNLPSQTITEKEFISALDDVLGDEKTTFTLKLNQHITLSNSKQIIREMLETRLNTLNSMDVKDASVKAEIEHLNKALNNVDKLNLSILVNNPIKIEEEKAYHLAFNLAVNTGKYLYSLDDAIVSKRIYNGSALQHVIEEHIDNLAELKVNATPSTEINKVLYIINETAFDLNNEQTQAN